MQKCYRTFGNSSSLWQSLSGRMKLTPTVLKSAAVLMLLLLQVLKRQWPLLMKPVILFIIMKAWMLNANSIPGPANVWCIQCTVHAELCQCNYAQVCSNNAAGWLRIEKSRTSCSVRATKKNHKTSTFMLFFFFYLLFNFITLCYCTGCLYSSWVSVGDRVNVGETKGMCNLNPVGADQWHRGWWLIDVRNMDPTDRSRYVGFANTLDLFI